jgi:hypothetical protein
MFAPSFSRWPVAPVEFARSEPARSTRLAGFRLECIGNMDKQSYLIRDTFSVSRFVSTSWRIMVSMRVKTACERDDLGRYEDERACAMKTANH